MAIKKIFENSARYIDYPMAWKGALFLALIVYFINLPHGALAAIPAAIKQGSYTFFVAGFIVKLSKHLAHNPGSGALSIPLAIFLPSFIAIALTYLLHSAKGTPEPFYSTLPTLIMAPPAFGLIVWRQLRTTGDSSNE